MTSHYIYEINFLCGSLKGHYYIGKRTCKGDPYKDKYTGSGNVPREYFKKYGAIEGVTYDKLILEFNDSAEKNSDREVVWVGNAYRDDKLCVNLKAGGQSGEGFIPSKLTRQLMSKAHKGKAPVKATIAAQKKNSKPVAMFNPDGTIVNIYRSAIEAAKVWGLDRRQICDCCNGKQKTHKGFTFKYV